MSYLKTCKLCEEVIFQSSPLPSALESDIKFKLASEFSPPVIESVVSTQSDAWPVSSSSWALSEKFEAPPPPLSILKLFIIVFDDHLNV